MKKRFVKVVVLLALIGAFPIAEDRRIAAEPTRTVWITPIVGEVNVNFSG